MEENALLVYVSIFLLFVCCRWGPRDHFDDLPVISGGRRANHLSTGTNTKDGSSTRRSHGAVDFHWSSIGMWWQLHVKLLSLIYFSVVWYLTYEVANCLHCNVVLTMKLFRVTCSKDIFTQSWRCSPLFVWGIRWKDNRDCKQSNVFWRFSLKKLAKWSARKAKFFFSKIHRDLKK